MSVDKLLYRETRGVRVLLYDDMERTIMSKYTEFKNQVLGHGYDVDGAFGL